MSVAVAIFTLKLEFDWTGVMQNTSSNSPSDEPYRVPEYKVTHCSTFKTLCVQYMANLLQVTVSVRQNKQMLCHLWSFPSVEDSSLLGCVAVLLG